MNALVDPPGTSGDSEVNAVSTTPGDADTRVSTCWTMANRRSAVGYSDDGIDNRAERTSVTS